MLYFPHMSVQETIKENIKDAMRAKDQVKLDVFRGLSSSFTNELVAKGRKPQDELSDEEANTVIQRTIKQRRDSIEQFTAGGRTDLVAEEAAQLAILEALVPPMMSEDEVRAIVSAKAAELGVTDKSGIAKLMGAVMGELKGKADGTVVRTAVESILS